MSKVSPYLLGVVLGLVAMALAVSGGYAWGDHNDPDRSYCHFYPAVCAHNGGQAPW